MKDRNGNPIRLNDGVDPSMVGVKAIDCNHGRHMSPRRLRYLPRDLGRAEALGRLTTRVARHVRRDRPAA